MQENTSLKVQHFYHKNTFTLTYVVFSERSKEALVIDPVWDFDYASGKLEGTAVEEVIYFLKDKDLDLKAILESHVHADHLSGAQPLKNAYPKAQLAIGEKIKMVQKTFKGVFNAPHFPDDGAPFDKLLKDGEVWKIGEDLELKNLSTPGHTPACCSFLMGDKVFTGDSLFMPDFGSGRCDFPNGSAVDLYNSIVQKLYTLPDETVAYVGHDYCPGGRELRFKCTIGEQKQTNKHLKGETSEVDFVHFRTERDKELSAPKLLLPSLYVNMRGGQLPDPEDNGVSYLKIPLKI